VKNQADTSKSNISKNVSKIKIFSESNKSLAKFQERFSLLKVFQFGFPEKFNNPGNR